LHVYEVIEIAAFHTTTLIAHTGPLFPFQNVGWQALCGVHAKIEIASYSTFFNIFDLHFWIQSFQVNDNFPQSVSSCMYENKICVWDQTSKDVFRTSKAAGP
jgi:hypothetical protein